MSLKKLYELIVPLATELATSLESFYPLVIEWNGVQSWERNARRQLMCAKKTERGFCDWIALGLAS